MADRAEQRRRHWRANLCATAGLLLVWFGVSFVTTFFARDLNAAFFGWPFSFWVAAQGALLVYLALVWLYSRMLNRLDREHDLAEEESRGDLG
jgi:putative solute:sodium symporter small subunit